TFTAALASPTSNASVTSNGTGTVNTVDDNTATVTLDSITRITEGQSTTVVAHLHILRNGLSTSDTLATPVSVHLFGNSHYASSTETFPAGLADGATVTLTITSSEDLDVETNQIYPDNFVVTGVATAGGSPANVTINDNDAANARVFNLPAQGSYTLTNSGGNILIHQGNSSGNVLASVPLNDNSPPGFALKINGRGGDDNLTLDLSTGDVVPVGGLFFNGVGQTAADALHIVGGNQ